MSETLKNHLKKLPCVALYNLVILPKVLIHFDLEGEKSVSAVNAAMLDGQEIFVTAAKKSDEDEPGPENIYSVGTVAKIRQVIRMPGNMIRILVESLERAELVEVCSHQDYMTVEVRTYRSEETEDVTPETAEAMRREIGERFDEFVRFYPRVGKALGKEFDEIQSLSDLMDAVIANLPLPFDRKQEVLETIPCSRRFETVLDILEKEIRIAGIRSEMYEKVQGRVNQEQKDYYLREQMRYIREELGYDNQEGEADRYQRSCDALDAPEEVKERIKKEIERFRNTPSGSSESGVQQVYIETLLDMPWNKVSEENKSLENASRILERDHYGLEKVKERILEFLAVKNLTEKGQSPIILLVGPPGTGKTSVAKSIAEALNRKYLRISLGGVRDEAEIRGHRKTYVGAMPGVLASGIQRMGVRNPLILLDEVDKLSSDYHGSVASALLEVLDSEQNRYFRDHYIEVPLDLSDVLFLATANSVQEIPAPLLDRMEVVELSGYTENEKYHIAKEHLIRKQLKANGLKASNLRIADDALREIIRSYTREAGVRKLERKIGELCRKTAKAVYAGEKKSVRVTRRNLESFLGKPLYLPEEEAGEDSVGIVRGLAWTSVGGVTLEIEVNTMPGKGVLQLTGKLGDVMKESAMAGLTYVRALSGEYGIAESYFRSHDFHIHIPEGAVPKDGPSAGITMATALFSAVTNIPVRSHVAMTGEITLRGRVLPVGGLKEKILAARNVNVTKVVLPEKNRRDVDEISDEIKGGLEIIFVDNMGQVLSEALVRMPEKKKAGRKKPGKTEQTE